MIVIKTALVVAVVGLLIVGGVALAIYSHEKREGNVNYQLDKLEQVIENTTPEPCNFMGYDENGEEC